MRDVPTPEEAISWAETFDHGRLGTDVARSVLAALADAGYRIVHESRVDEVEVVPVPALDALRAENELLQEALERAADICEDAATMGCDCDGDYYKCGPCPSAIASRADDAVEVLRAALAVPAPKPRIEPFDPRDHPEAFPSFQAVPAPKPKEDDRDD